MTNLLKFQIFLLAGWNKVRIPAGARKIEFFSLPKRPERLGQCWRIFPGARAQIVYKFWKNTTRTHGNLKEQNQVMEPSIIIINYTIIIINAHYYYIVQLMQIIIIIIIIIFLIKSS